MAKKKIIYEHKYCRCGTNIFIVSKVAGVNRFSVGNRYNRHSSMMIKFNTGWIKSNRNPAKARRIQKSVISYVCRDSKGHIIKKENSNIGGILVLVAGNLVIRKAFDTGYR